MSVKRIHNFSAGPAVLPLPVLEKAQQSLLNFDNNGMSIMEMSHRSAAFEAVLAQAKEGIQTLLAVPDTHEVLFLQGGASLQFSMVAQNLAQEGKTAQLIQSGIWTKKALAEIKKITPVAILASSQDQQFLALPDLQGCDVPQDSSFVYACSNNTIMGTQFKVFPDTGTVPLVVDMSSDILSRPLPIQQMGLVFAGAQKNIGPAGVTIVIIKKELLARSADMLPAMLSYRSYAESNSLYNTIPTFGIYMISLVTEWLIAQGGLAAIEKNNQEKASRLYSYIDDSSYYKAPVPVADRSLMNVVFRLNDTQEREVQFYKEAQAAGLDGLKGHRSVGGLRASIYNAQTQEAIDALLEFMHSFAAKHQ